jgi:hypothetical protein
MCLGVFPFPLFLRCVMYQLYYHVCVLCSVYGSNILNYLYYFYFLFMFFMSLAKCSARLSYIGVNPCISFSKCHFFRICVFADGVLQCFVLCFVFERRLITNS